MLKPGLYGKVPKEMREMKDPEALFTVTLQKPQKGPICYTCLVDGKPNTTINLYYVEILHMKDKKNGDVEIVAPKCYLEPCGFKMDRPIPDTAWSAMYDALSEEGNKMTRRKAFTDYMDKPITSAD